MKYNKLPITITEQVEKLNTFFKAQAPLNRTVTIPPTSWEQWCGNPIHSGCDEGRGAIADTQDTISSVQCTNDPSKAAIVIRVY